DTASNTRAAQRRLDNVAEFIDWIARVDERQDGTTAGLDEIVRKLSLMDFAARSDDGDDDEVHLLTLHAVKGLEFDHVWLVGLEEGLLPHHACIDDDKIEEERRLLYVGITRARKGLALTYARRRRRGGETMDTTPSRFLEELPADEIGWPGANASSAKASVDSGRSSIAAVK